MSDTQEKTLLQSAPGLLSETTDDATPSKGAGFDWKGAAELENPLNWSSSKRWANIITVAILGLIPNMGTTICAPGIEGIVEDFNITNDTASTLAITIYLLGLALGPLLLSSFSEIWGRLPIYHGGNVVFIAFLIGNAFSQTTAQFMVFRFLSAFGGGMPLALGGGTIADLTRPSERGLATALFSLGPLAGPVLGPVIGGFVASGKGWRWTFWVLAILAGAVEILTILVMRETSAQKLLERKVARLRIATNDSSIRSRFVGEHSPDPVQMTLRAIVGPTILLFKSPSVLILSIYAALVFGVMYLLFTTFDGVFQGQYGFSESVSGLAYLGLGVALVLGVVVFGNINANIQAAARKDMESGESQKPSPEKRLLPMIWFSPLVGMGLFMYGWTVQYKVQWIVPIISTSFIGLGAYFVLVPTQLYLIELFGPRAPAALSANNLLRYLGGVFLPLAGQSLYKALGYGWGSTLLGFLALAFVAAPIFFWRYGEKLRANKI